MVDVNLRDPGDDAFYVLEDGEKVPRVTHIIKAVFGHAPAEIRMAWEAGAAGETNPLYYMGERAKEGKRIHKINERIAKGEEDPVLLVDSHNGYEMSLARAWVDLAPVVRHSEMRLVSKKHSYAGTCDLIGWFGLVESGSPMIVDLKTRNRWATKSYLGDRVQCRAYAVAYEEMTGEKCRTAVLIAREDGFYIFDQTEADEAIWLRTLDLYRVLQGG